MGLLPGEWGRGLNFQSSQRVMMSLECPTAPPENLREQPGAIPTTPPPGPGPWVLEKAFSAAETSAVGAGKKDPTAH